ncbi:MAG: hypothetical protein R3F34_00270 [Planctomycetota bacterium]
MRRSASPRALCRRPALLLLDEPLGLLDAELRGSMLTMLDELRERLGFAALHVTHDPGEARGVRTRTVRLEDGRIGELGNRHVMKKIVGLLVLGLALWVGINLFPSRAP